MLVYFFFYNIVSLRILAQVLKESNQIHHNFPNSMRTKGIRFIFRTHQPLQVFAPFVVLFKGEWWLVNCCASRELDNCTRWRQWLKTLQKLDDNNAAVIYCGCSRNSEFGNDSRRRHWRGAIKVNSEVGGKWGVCVVKVSGVLPFLVRPTGVVSDVAAWWLCSATLQHSHILSQIFSLLRSPIGSVTLDFQLDH